MKTITIQIGNSDDRLTQRGWSNFILAVDMYVRAYSQVHYFGTSNGDESWQNACWVSTIEHEEDFTRLKSLLGKCSKEFQQDSIAWTVGETEFI